MKVNTSTRYHTCSSLFWGILLQSIFFMFFATVSKAQSANTAFDKTTSIRMLAYQYLQENKPYEAEAAFLKAIQIDPKKISNYRDLSLLYLREKRYNEAEKEANTALKFQNGNLEIRSILAKIYVQKGDKPAAAKELKTIISKSPKNVYAYYTLMNLTSPGTGDKNRKASLLKILSFAPANIVLRLELAELFAENGNSDSALSYLQSIKKISPGFSSSAAIAFRKSINAIQANRFSSALSSIRQFHNLMKTTVIYADGLADIEGPKLPEGNVDFTTSQIAHKNKITRKITLHDISFADITKNVVPGISEGGKIDHSVIAVTDYNNMGQMYLYTGNSTGNATECHLLTSEIGAFREANVLGGLSHDGIDNNATFADYNNDGYQDLFIANTKGILVYKNNGDGTFSKQKDGIGIKNAVNGQKLLFADFDQDGDLDLYVAQKAGNKFFRNNGDGTFTEQSAGMGLTSTRNGGEDIDYADWDSDGDLDIVTVSEKNGIALLDNNRHSKFQDITSSTGLNRLKIAGTAVAFADYNNDGMQDLFIAGKRNSPSCLLKNAGNNHFVVDPSSKLISTYLGSLDVHAVAFLDFDNDGYLDLLVAGTTDKSNGKGVQLFHNEGAKRFTNVSYLLPPTVQQAYQIGIADFNADGDDDIFLSGPNGAQLIRNDGGSLNNYLQVQLIGLSYGNSKNNRLGIGAQVALKAGDLYQTRTVKRSVLNLGVGSRSKLDAVRVVWPNGMPQTIADPSSSERIIEQEMLKGSCPFLFTWNGERYEFIKDMLWRSALGMPLAINGKDTTYSFSDASKEYLLIPGEKLKAKNGRYRIKITEELWEAVYFDKAGLVAVDHPDSVDTYVDERFVPPPFPGRKVYQAARKYLPVSAKDEKGNDLLPKVSRYDFQYASSFSLGKFQGLAEDHDLILDLGNNAKGDSLRLFLRGWIFPTDASINTAMTQSDKYKIHPPCLQVIDGKGEWRTVISNLGFPMGRDKMVIADLSGKFLTKNDHRVRIRTNMQIYWDHIFFTTGRVESPVRMTDLVMTRATLGFRGYSSSYRKGGPYGPEWFDYDHVTGGQKWRDLTGNYTRYGDVLPLLQQGDDKYIIADGGDEISIDFDEQRLPKVPKGWKRDFLIYSEGWVKDGDLNTANGQTVAPLPFHGMPSYPYSKNIAYPADKEHQEYQQKYNTRKVTTFDFKNALKPGMSKKSAKSTR
ncbi:CRTAC1 family protein [Mucilaginibacter ginsenosidivorans]|nr:CRTAC1 family protein [Mucilaginibacter ginsenosidivorans]